MHIFIHKMAKRQKLVEKEIDMAKLAALLKLFHDDAVVAACFRVLSAALFCNDLTIVDTKGKDLTDSLLSPEEVEAFKLFYRKAGIDALPYIVAAGIAPMNISEMDDDKKEETFAYPIVPEIGDIRILVQQLPSLKSHFYATRRTQLPSDAEHIMVIDEFSTRAPGSNGGLRTSFSAVLDLISDNNLL